jgi:hypothetical protein
LIIYPLSALAALLIYQGTNSGLYYIVGMIAYFWAYSEGEVCLFREFGSGVVGPIANGAVDCLPGTLDTAETWIYRAEPGLVFIYLSSLTFQDISIYIRPSVSHSGVVQREHASDRMKRWIYIIAASDQFWR